jgi:hypothetical protein
MITSHKEEAIMVHADEVTEQLRRIGRNHRFWNVAELRELPRILFENEQIKHVCNGRYEGGFCLLVTTDQRVLLIDKKPFYLTLEDIRYERITDVQLMHRLLDATIRLGSLTKNLIFTSYNPPRLREATSYIQEMVMVSRQLRQAALQHNVNEQASRVLNIPQSQQAYYEQQNAAPAPVDKLLDPTQPVQNPYRSPLMFRRRVSRYY